MMTDQRADDRAPLRTRASAIEIVAADHPAWEISRDRDGAAHGHWRATRGDATVSAPTTPELLDALEAHELDRLRAEHVDRWRVWRTPRYWMAGALVAGVEPTLMEESAGAPSSTRARGDSSPGRARRDPRRVRPPHRGAHHPRPRARHHRWLPSPQALPHRADRSRTTR